jgi:hypothetical protein
MGLLRLIGLVLAVMASAATVTAAVRTNELEIKLCRAAQTLAELPDECLPAMPFWLPYLVVALLITVGLAWALSPKRRIGETARLAIKGPRFHQYPPDQSYTTSFCRLAVHNRGPATAKNVRMRLLSIEPRPRHSSWLADYPYPVARVAQPVEAAACALDRDADELFQLACGWKNSRGEFMAGLDTKSAFHNPTLIEPDERWQLTYEVTADNAAAVTFLLEMFVDSGGVAMRRSGWRGLRVATLRIAATRFWLRASLSRAA